MISTTPMEARNPAEAGCCANEHEANECERQHRELEFERMQISRKRSCKGFALGNRLHVRAAEVGQHEKQNADDTKHRGFVGA
ncbi:MAG: hypothetical protein ACREMS_11095 [Gemmatimonadaceae bacterium]